MGAAAIVAALCLSACAPDAEVDDAQSATDGTLTVLVGEGVHRQILETAAQLAAGDLDLVVEPAGDDANRRVANGEADVAYAQHLPAFEGQTQQDGIEGLSVLARVHVVPYGLYSRGCSALDEIPHFGSLLLPDGQAPLARSLYLLQHAKLMTLNREFGGTAFEDLSITEANVVDSQRHLALTQAPAEQFPQVLDAVDAAVMSPELARENGFAPSDALIREPAAGNPYANVAVVRSDEVSDPDLAVLAHHLESPELARAIDRTFDGAVIPATPADPEPDVTEPGNTYTGDPEDYEGPRSCTAG